MFLDRFFQKKKAGPAHIGFFGGSFNPPHVGHSAICRWLFARKLIDELWIVPCFAHPFGKELLPFEDRLAMSKLAFGKLGLPIHVLDIEAKLGGISYTARTLEYMRSHYPSHRFSLITGGDVQEEVGKWRDYDRITAMAETIRVLRGPDSHIPDISSTEIRRRLSEGESYRDFVEPEVAVYIITKGLFR